MYACILHGRPGHKPPVRSGVLWHEYHRNNTRTTNTYKHTYTQRHTWLHLANRKKCYQHYHIVVYETGCVLCNVFGTNTRNEAGTNRGARPDCTRCTRPNVMHEQTLGVHPHTKYQDTQPQQQQQQHMREISASRSAGAREKLGKGRVWRNTNVQYPGIHGFRYANVHYTT